MRYRALLVLWVSMCVLIPDYCAICQICPLRSIELIPGDSLSIDLNNDGVDERLLLKREPHMSKPDSLFLISSNEEGTLSDRSLIGSPVASPSRGIVSISIIDIDNNGICELFTHLGGTLSPHGDTIWLSKLSVESGRFNIERIIATPFMSTVADVNSDNICEIIVYDMIRIPVYQSEGNIVFISSLITIDNNIMPTISNSSYQSFISGQLVLAESDLNQALHNWQTLPNRRNTLLLYKSGIELLAAEVSFLDSTRIEDRFIMLKEIYEQLRHSNNLEAWPPDIDPVQVLSDARITLIERIQGIQNGEDFSPIRHW
ncbi:hypothetical protein ACFL3X_01820 [Gemmatimonadota bacterium]